MPANDITFTAQFKDPNPTENTVIKSFSGTKAINCKEKVHIIAYAEKLPEGYAIAIYEGSSVKAKAVADENKKASVEWTSENLTANKTYSVKIIDVAGRVQKDNNECNLEKIIVINVNAGFFKKLIAFFKGLFGSLATIDIKP